MEEPWRAVTEKYFGRSSCKKWHRLRNDVLSVTHGLKPSLLVDYLPQEASKFQQLLNGLIPLELSGLHINTKIPKKLCVIDVEQNILLSTSDYFQHLAQANSDVCRDTTCEYVNVTRDRALSLASPSTSNIVRDQLVEWCQAVSHKITKCQDSIPVIEVPFAVSPELVTPHPNLCTLFGQLVGYPVVYWFETERGYCLDTVDLVHHSLTLQSTSDSDWLPASAQGHTLFSFTVPRYIMPQVKHKIDAWTKQKKEVAATMSVEVDLSCRDVCLPNIAL